MAGKFRRISLHRAVFLTFLVIAVSLTASFLYVYGTFYRIENISEITKNQYLPQLIDKQRILVNIETLRRQLELIHTSGRQDEVRKAQVVAQALMAEAVFEQSRQFHEKVLELHPDILLLIELKEKLLLAEEVLQGAELHLQWLLGRFSVRTGSAFRPSDASADRAPEGGAKNSDAVMLSAFGGLCEGDGAVAPDCRALQDGREAVSAATKNMRALEQRTLKVKERLEEGLNALSDYTLTMEVLKISSDMMQVGTTVSHVRVQFILIGAITFALLLGCCLLIRLHILKPLVSMARFLHNLRLGRKTQPLSAARIKEIQQIMDMLPLLRTVIERLSMRTSLLLEERNEYAKLSLRDALTGLGNRLALEARKHADMPGLPLAALMFDIDFFKKYNDTFGHPEGDRCLQRVASAAKGCLRSPSDDIFRYGGEEFLVLVPGADSDVAGRIAVRILESIRKMGIAHPGSPGGTITVSVGVACRALGDTTTFDELTAQADEALYVSKKNGRNRMTVFSG